MTAPRFLPKGKTREVTRRCIFRQYRLRPSLLVRQVTGYLLGYCSEKHDIELHWFVFMDNHFHLMLTDPHGKLPAFMRDFDSLLARALNSIHGDWESFWAPESYFMIDLGDKATVFDKMVYMAVNPVKAGLVKTHKDWPGLMAKVADLNAEPFVFKRPDVTFFKRSKRKVMPKQSSVKLTIPPAYADRDPEAFKRELSARIYEREKEITKKMKEEGMRFRGKDNVLKKKRHDSPKTKAPRRNLRPKVACKKTKHRIALLKEHSDFQNAYADALEEFKKTNRDCLFPYGTYLMKLRFNVRVATPS